MKTYKVIKNRRHNAQPFIVKKGDVVRIIKASDDQAWLDWYFCESKKYSGWVPKQFLEIIGREGIVLSDYNTIEFNLCIGEILYESYSLNGWIWCTKISNPSRQAWAPINHLMEI